MKRLSLISICLLVFLVGSVVGYHVGVRKTFQKMDGQLFTNELERAQENIEFEARGYFHCLQALDANDITNLHEFALHDLRFYVSDVQQSRSEGYTWAPHIMALYISATNYLAEHPQSGSDKTRRPNKSLQPTATVPSVSTNK
jgi:hypothetical protein